MYAGVNAGVVYRQPLLTPLFDVVASKPHRRRRRRRRCHLLHRRHRLIIIIFAYWREDGLFLV